ncbi:hypothetical protein L561_0022 [Bordetella pertussis STO1-CHOC-0019]|nr:hypothetical protein L561_0022 [Bordetella pertussis STO1-CHOC-0019]
MSELGVGDFQFLKSGSDEPCIQPIESSHLALKGLVLGRPLCRRQFHRQVPDFVDRRHAFPYLAGRDSTGNYQGARVRCHVFPRRRASRQGHRPCRHLAAMQNSTACL